jgi:hypothetical protein
MIKNLMKYDIKKMLRIVIYIDACAILLAALTRLVGIWDNIQLIYIIKQFFQGFTYSAIASVLINTFIHILAVFITNFYKDESYLTHTLPVTKSQLLISKYLSALISVVSSVAVCFVSLFIMLYSKGFIEALKAFIKATVADFNVSVGLFVFILVYLIFAQLCSIISMTFSAVIKANRYNAKRIIKGLLWFFAYYLIASLAFLVVAAIVFLIRGSIGDMFAEQMSQASFLCLLTVGCIMYTLSAVFFYFFSEGMFKKGVNVD